MSFRQGYDHLNQKWCKLCRDWSRTRFEWNDVIQSEFEHQYWIEVEKVLPEYLECLVDIAETVEKARQSIR